MKPTLVALHVASKVCNILLNRKVSSKKGHTSVILFQICRTADMETLVDQTLLHL